MKVYKFGGASVRNADGVRNLRHIVDGEDNLFIIVSAMGKTTNALERVFTHMQKVEKEAANEEIKQIQEYHSSIIDELWGEHTDINEVTLLFGQLRNIVNDIVYRPSDAELWYDTIVAFGELISTTIISKYLNHTGLRNRWIDMRTTFITNERHKDANVNIKASEHRLKASLENTGVGVFVGQGFIGAAPDGTTTTLGREGSDYSAAVVAHILDAESMSVWKDVDGVLNADPKIFKDAVKIDSLNYLDTIELAYSGAQIIHPKTIKPLQNKNIPLYVRPFGDKSKPGTVINGEAAHVTLPILIYKRNQVLLIIRSKDFSFVMEEKFAVIFALLDRFRIKTHLINNSAVDLGLCIDSSWHIDSLIKALEAEDFEVELHDNVGLLTIRNYNDDLYLRYVKQQNHIVRQVNPESVRVVLRDTNF
ncbi:MAG: aspartate kinase [Alistipes sp.]|nr:aspartate kinase [Alistipes sp.]MBR2170522.1 aspartate kinase [Alistipes sp.]MBR2331305.1 aspartate kinase [Alistipes sp.]MBR6662979.1 aspartate kinase [Alistipes sp.]MBR6672388.1 aspartate kinase [Alistipes sp.]